MGMSGAGLPAPSKPTPTWYLLPAQPKLRHKRSERPSTQAKRPIVAHTEKIGGLSRNHQATSRELLGRRVAQ